jgi:hypothetical protein
MRETIDAWEMTPEQYVKEIARYHDWLGSLWTNYYQACQYMITRDGMTGRVVSRANWILDNLMHWADDDVSLVAYCTRSLFELAVILWSVDRSGDWQRWFGLAATDLTDCVKKIIRLGIGPEEEGRQNLRDLKEAFGQVGLVVPEETQRVRTEAENAGYLQEYDEAFQWLSKFVHPTPMVLFGPPIDAQNLDKLRKYFLMKAVKYVHTIYCLAAEQSGYNLGEIDLAGHLAQLRTELAQ